MHLEKCTLRCVNNSPHFWIHLIIKMLLPQLSAMSDEEFSKDTTTSECKPHESARENCSEEIDVLLEKGKLDIRSQKSIDVSEKAGAQDIVSTGSSEVPSIVKANCGCDNCSFQILIMS